MKNNSSFFITPLGQGTKQVTFVLHGVEENNYETTL